MAKSNRILIIPALIITFILIISSSYSQSVTWQRTYQGPYFTANEYGYSSCRADGDNIYVIGSISNAQIFLLKLNPLGDTLWSKIIGNGYSRGSAITEADSGGCVFTGWYENSQPFAMKVNKNGVLVWQKFYGNYYCQMFDIKRTFDNNFLLCGSEGNYNTILIKIDSYGNLIWRKIYSAGHDILFTAIEEFGNNGYIITGYKADSVYQISTGLIVITDLNGTIIRDTTFTMYSGRLSGQKIIKTNTGYTIASILSNPYKFKIVIVRTDNLGRIISLAELDSSRSRFDIGDFKMINPNRYLMPITEDSGSALIGKILLLDSSGIEIKSRSFKCVRQIMFGECTVLADTGYIFCGFLDNHGNSGRDLYVIKLDTGLSTPPFIGINSISSEVPISFKLYQNYPNPFNPSTNIKFEIPESGQRSFHDIQLKIFDILGREIYSINDNKPAGVYEFRFVGSNLASGMYFYKLISGDFTETKKMILLK